MVPDSGSIRRAHGLDLWMQNDSKGPQGDIVPYGCFCK